ncbi:MAG: RsmE family RNA methyltransferase [Pseudomonadota bacterium]
MTRVHEETGLRVPRVHVTPAELCIPNVTFRRDTSKYLRTVLRLKRGDLVEVFGLERSYIVKLTRVDGIEVSGAIMEESTEPEDAAPEIVLAIACIRPGPFSEVLRHGTELGVKRFVPLVTARSQRRPDGRKERWGTITASAAAQSGRAGVPVVEAPSIFADFLVRDFSCADTVVLSPAIGARPFLEVMMSLERKTELVLLVGPEGGLDPEEEQLAEKAGFEPAGLGSAILRSETAAMAAVAVAAAWREWTGGSWRGKKMALKSRGDSSRADRRL